MTQQQEHTIWTDEQHAAYELGIQTEREHQEALARLAMKKHAEEIAAANARAAELERKVACYESPLPEMVDGKYVAVTDHRFTDDGFCVRCGEDAEEWDAGCVESIVNDVLKAEAERDELRETLDERTRAHAELLADWYRLTAEVQRLKQEQYVPDWSNAPEWANWYAVDSNGGAYWYKDEPVQGNQAWVNLNTAEWDATICPNWRNSLHCRLAAQEQEGDE